MDTLLSAFTGAIRLDGRISNKWRLTHREAGTAILAAVQDAGTIAEAVYRLTNQMKARPQCLTCGGRVLYPNREGSGYRRFCSRACSNSHEVTHAKMAKTRNLHFSGHQMQSPAVVEKRRQTMKARHGGTGFASIPITEKIQDTMRIQHGASHNWQATALKETYITRRRDRFIVNKLPMLARRGITALFQPSDYLSNTQPLQWSCACGTIFTDSIEKGLLPRCLTCFPHLAGASAQENDLAAFIEGLGFDVTRSYRGCGDGRTLDVFIPSKNLAFEFNGIYWHSELAGRGPRYHLSKIEAAATNNICVTHIFEDDWIRRPELIRSMVAVKLGVVRLHIHARQTQIELLTPKQAGTFLESHHLQGRAGGLMHLGLIFAGDLVAVATVGKPRFGGADGLELVRWATRANTVIPGGFSKVLRYLQLQYPSSSILSYADRSHSTGNLYQKTGFTLVRTTPPAPWYFSHKEPWRHHRLGFQKHLLTNRLTKFDPALTAWENIQLGGWNRIWDCGQLVFNLPALCINPCNVI